MRLGGGGLKLDGTAIGGDRFGGAALGVQGVAEVVVCIGVVGIDCRRALGQCDRLAELRGGGVAGAEVVQRFSQVRFDRDRGAECVSRLIHAPERLQGDAEVIVPLRDAWRETRSPRDQVGRRGQMAESKRQPAQSMQGHRLVRALLENAAVYPLSVGESAGALMHDPHLDRLLNGSQRHIWHHRPRDDSINCGVAEEYDSLKRCADGDTLPARSPHEQFSPRTCACNFPSALDSFFSPVSSPFPATKARPTPPTR